MPKTPTRVALYARVSTKDKRQDTENQLAQLRQFCETQRWTVVHEYVDKATGKHSDREQFQRLFADASQRQFDVVLFWSLDRFSREGVRETLNHLERLDNYGVGYQIIQRAIPGFLWDIQGRGFGNSGRDRQAGAGKTIRAHHRRIAAGPKGRARGRQAEGGMRPIKSAAPASGR